MVFVFFSLMEYALVNVVLGDVPEEGRHPPQQNKPNNNDKITPQVNVSQEVSELNSFLVFTISISIHSSLIKFVYDVDY